MFTIAIDGPAGAGKTTTAKKVAKELGFLYFDTGAMYRMIALHILRKINPFSEKGYDSVKDIDNEYAEILIDDADIDAFNMKLNNEYVGDKIRTDEVSQAASIVSALPSVREFLLHKQKSVAKQYNVVMEGRDIGTVIIPDADLKIFLTADIYTRTARRMMQMPNGSASIFRELLDSMKERDTRDTTRAIAPLRRADDAIYIDNTMLSFENTVEIIVAIAEKRMRTKQQKIEK